MYLLIGEDSRRYDVECVAALLRTVAVVGGAVSTKTTLINELITRETVVKKFRGCDYTIVMIISAGSGKTTASCSRNKCTAGIKEYVCM